MLSERNQIQKCQCFLVHVYEVSRIQKSIEIQSRLMVAKSWGEEGRELLLMVSFWGDENVVELSSGYSNTTLRIY